MNHYSESCSVKYESFLFLNQVDSVDSSSKKKQPSFLRLYSKLFIAEKRFMRFQISNRIQTCYTSSFLQFHQVFFVWKNICSRAENLEKTIRAST